MCRGYQIYKHILTFLFVFIIPLMVWSEVPRCYQDIERNFFQPGLVSQALAFNGTSIPQSTWVPIGQAIAQQAKNVPNIVRDRSRRMNPNPFGIPFDPRGAGEVLKAALIEVLANALAPFGITNTNQIYDIFLYIQERQMDRWKACFGKEEHK